MKGKTIGENSPQVSPGDSPLGEKLLPLIGGKEEDLRSMPGLLKAINEQLGVKKVAPELQIAQSQVYRIASGERPPTVKQVIVYLRLAAEAGLPEADELLAHFSRAAGKLSISRAALHGAIRLLVGGREMEEVA